MVPIETQGLRRGQVVSYGDQANPRHNAVVIESEGSSPYGQRCVFEDSFLITTVSTTAIDCARPYWTWQSVTNHNTGAVHVRRFLTCEEG